MIDVTARPDRPLESQRTTYPGSVRISLGGVGRNLAEAATRIVDSLTNPASGAVKMVAPIAADSSADFLKGAWKTRTSLMRTDGLFTPSRAQQQTPAASLTLDQNGDLENGIINTGLVDTAFDDGIVDTAFRSSSATHVAIDCNVSVEGITSILGHAARRDAFVLCEPTSLPKCSRLVEALQQTGHLGQRQVLGAITPNAIELLEIYHAIVRTAPNAVDPSRVHEQYKLALLEVRQLAVLDRETAEAALATAYALGPVFLTLGKDGLLTIVPPSAQDGHDTFHIVHTPSPAKGAATIVNTTGAGDTLAGALLAFAYLASAQQGRSVAAQDLWRSPMSNAIYQHVQTAALRTLASEDAVGDLLSLQQAL